MKKGEERRKGDKNQEDKLSDPESDNGEFGSEYEFFMTEVSQTKEHAKDVSREPVKGEDNTDQTKTFFLPDLFFDED